MSGQHQRIWLVLGVGLSCGLIHQAPCRASEDLSKIQHILRLPPDLGRVTGASFPHGRHVPEFVLIRDTHGNPQVQVHIAALLIHAYHHWGVRKIFLEGADSPIEIDRFQDLPRGPRRALLVEDVLQGHCTGAEMAAVLLADTEREDGTSQSPFQLVGGEDPRLYAQNVEMYERVLAGQQRALQALEVVRRLHQAMSIPPGDPLARQLERAERLIALQMTPDIYQDYLAHRDLTPSLPESAPVIQAAEAFYQLARARSLILLKEASRKLPASQGPRVIVSGGFHTGDMVACLRREGKSYIVLTPSLPPAACPATLYLAARR